MIFKSSEPEAGMLSPGCNVNVDDQPSSDENRFDDFDAKVEPAFEIIEFL